MTIEDFLKSPEGREMLERTNRVGSIAVAAFRLCDGEEKETLSQCGTCAQACAYVSKMPWGAQTCRKSREKAVATAMRRGKPIPFLCHMGFSNVAVQAEKDGQNAALVLGPFYPADIPVGEDTDLIEGLRKLGEGAGSDLPFSVNDIPRLDAQAIPALAEWTRDAISDRCTQLEQEPSEPVEIDEKNVAPPRKRGIYQAGADDAKALLAAAIAGDGKRGSQIIDSVLAQPARKKNGLIAVQRSRCLMLVANVLSEAESGGLDTTKSWDHIDGITQVLVRESDLALWRKSILTALRPLRRLSSEGEVHARDFTLLDTLLKEHLVTGITLAEAARKLNQNPTTITKRLQRNFGMSYSDYVGRLRVDRAKQLLATTNLTVTEVAHRVGLNDSSNFSKLFKKHAGKSPAKYRRQPQASRKG